VIGHADRSDLTTRIRSLLGREE
ncbi:MAG: NAD(P)H-dependent oxidoreductase subunit E, partial [Chloroflexi bacterium]